jgi:transcriptional regulator with XRE-family HTH domain
MEKTGSVSFMKSKILGANIRNYRKQIGLTQEKLAERIGKSVNYVGMIERGEKVPSLKTFILIANALGASTDVLLVGITENSYVVRDSLLHERICKLDSEKKMVLYSVIDAFLNSAG